MCEAGGKRRGLAEVAAEADHAQPRIARLQRCQLLERIIRTAIVNDQQLAPAVSADDEAACWTDTCVPCSVPKSCPERRPAVVCAVAPAPCPEGTYRGANADHSCWGECLACASWCPEAIPAAGCNAPPPDCPSGQVPTLGADECWTGTCVDCPPAPVCEPGEPATDVPAIGCGDERLPRDDLPLLCEDLAPCESDDDCALTNTDPCCFAAGIAVLASRVDEVEERVGRCPDEAPACPPCVIGTGRAACVAGRCEIEPNAGR